MLRIHLFGQLRVFADGMLVGLRTAQGGATAVALYTGDLLDHVYDDWLFYERERLRANYHGSLDRLIVRCRAERAYPHQCLETIVTSVLGRLLLPG